VRRESGGDRGDAAEARDERCDLAYLALLAIIALGSSAFDKPASVWPMLLSLLALITGCGPIGPEFSSGTLQLILVKPVNRATYLLSRVAGVVLAVWAAAIVAALFELAGRAIWSNNVAAAIIGATLLNVMMDTILAVSLLTLLGSLTRAYFNIAIYVVTMVGFSMLAVALGIVRQTRNAFGRFLNEHIAIERALNAIDSNLFPDLPQRLDAQWTLMVLANAAVALALACLAFRRREVPYGAD
jgi:ABC-type transport system involved in multi-copper enzyme maturation permease subunit